jgi:cation diffusion facilitator family transporter
MNKQEFTMSKAQWMVASVLFNALLAGLEIFWSIYSNSTVMYADAIHSSADVLGAFLVFLAIKYSNYKSDKFPYGLNKLENIAALIGGVVVLLAGYEIVRSVFFEDKISSTDKPIETIIFMSLVISITMVFYYFERKAAKRLNSPGVQADAANWLGDMATNFVVIIGTVGVLFQIPYIEQIAVVIIVVFVFKSAFEIIRNSILALLDASANPEMIQKIRTVISSYQKESKIQFLKVTPAGSVYYVTASIELDEKSLKEAHTLADMISQEIKDKVDNIEEVIIHFEPINKDYNRFAILLDEDKKTRTKDFGKAVWILYLDQNEEGKIINHNFLRNPNLDATKGRGIRLIAFLINKNIDVLIKSNIKIENPLASILLEVGIELREDKFISSYIKTITK